jgi:ribonucleoside-triphosphate reductase (formate)
MNLPRLGHLASDEADFFSRLDHLMHLARTSLEAKRKVLESFTDKGLYPYTKHYLRSVKQARGTYWDNHFSTIGLVGMNEACQGLLHCGVGDPAGRSFALRVLDFMRKRLEEFQSQTGHQYNLEATPAEGTSFRLANIDKRKHPSVEAANEAEVAKGAKPFYTNSSQLPVNYSSDPFEVLDLQDELQCRYTGGTVLHFYLGEAVADPEAVKSFIRTVCDKYRLPYFSLTPTFSICPEHGYLRGEQPTCPNCGRQTEVYSRVVGYLRPISQWNDGKQAEFKMRKPFSFEARSCK